MLQNPSGPCGAMAAKAAGNRDTPISVSLVLHFFEGRTQTGDDAAKGTAFFEVKRLERPESRGPNYWQRRRDHVEYPCR